MPEKSYNELVREVRQKDRHFRFFLGLFITIVLLGLTLLGLLSFEQVSQLKSQAAQRNKNLDTLITDNQRQTEYIKCIARFFNERNRANANLTSLDDCVIQRDDGSFTPPNNIPPDTKPVSSTSTVTVEPAQSQPGVTVVPADPNPTIVIPVPDNPVTPPTVEPERQPMEILGVPLCAPLTNVCIRR